jgi:hypothetical protein
MSMSIGRGLSRGDVEGEARTDTQYDAPVQAGDANVVVTKLADYLKSVNY